MRRLRDAQQQAFESSILLLLALVTASLMWITWGTLEYWQVVTFFFISQVLVILAKRLGRRSA